MPIYKYECEEGHEFHEVRPMAQQAIPAICDCGCKARNVVALPARRSPSPAGELYTVRGRTYTLDSADDIKRIHRENGLEERGTHKETWGKEMMETINENVARIKESTASGRAPKLSDLPMAKHEKKEREFRGTIRNGVRKARKKIGEIRVATSNIYNTRAESA